MERIHITDVSPRDGLQNQQVAVSTEAKLELIRLLAAAGGPSVEATSFVSPTAVPQMADAGELLPRVQAVLPALRTSVLVPNLKGLERAHAAGAREIAVVLSATETMNRKNINMGLAQATEVSEQTAGRGAAPGPAHARLRGGGVRVPVRRPHGARRRAAGLRTHAAGRRRRDRGGRHHRRRRAGPGGAAAAGAGENRAHRPTGRALSRHARHGPGQCLGGAAGRRAPFRRQRGLASAAARSRPARPATWPPKTWC